MFEDFGKGMVGVWGIAALALLATGKGRRVIRNSAKGVLKIAVLVSDKFQDVVNEVKEESSGLLSDGRATRTGRQSSSRSKRQHATAE